MYHSPTDQVPQFLQELIPDTQNDEDNYNAR